MKLEDECPLVSLLRKSLKMKDAFKIEILMHYAGDPDADFQIVAGSPPTETLNALCGDKLLTCDTKDKKTKYSLSSRGFCYVNAIYLVPLPEERDRWFYPDDLE